MKDVGGEAQKGKVFKYTAHMRKRDPYTAEHVPKKTRTLKYPTNIQYTGSGNVVVYT